VSCCASCATGSTCSGHPLAGPGGPCGSKYAYLVQAAGGRTKAVPFNHWCNVEDAKAWHAQAKHVRQLVRNALKGASLPGPIAQQVNTYQSAADSLPEPSELMAFGFGGCGEAVNAMVLNIESGACVLEMIETENIPVVAPGSNLPAPESSGGGFFDNLVGGAAVGSIGTLILIYFAAKALDR